MVITFGSGVVEGREYLAILPIILHTANEFTGTEMKRSAKPLGHDNRHKLHYQINAATEGPAGMLVSSMLTFLHKMCCDASRKQHRTQDCSVLVSSLGYRDCG